MKCPRAHCSKVVVALSVALLTTAAAQADVLIGFEWRPMTQTANVSDVVGVGLYAVSLTGNDEDFNSAQAIVTWDPAYLTLLGVDQTGAALQPPDDASGFPPGDSWGLNEPTASPPADGDGMWQGLVAPGADRLATPAGTLLTTLTFEALAETPCTEVTLLPQIQKDGYGTAWSKIVQNTDQGSYNVLDYSNLPTSACVEIIPEPAGVLGLALFATVLLRRVRRVG